MRQHDQDQQDAAFKQADELFQRIASRLPHEFIEMEVSSPFFEEVLRRMGEPELCEHLKTTPHQPAVCNPPLFGSQIMCGRCFLKVMDTESERFDAYTASTDCDFCGHFSTVFHEDTAIGTIGEPVEDGVRFPVFVTMCLCPGCHMMLKLTNRR